MGDHGLPPGVRETEICKHCGTLSGNRMVEVTLTNHKGVTKRAGQSFFVICVSVLLSKVVVIIAHDWKFLLSFINTHII